MFGSAYFLNCQVSRFDPTEPIFKYDDKDKCLKWFKNAMKHMEDNSRFNDFTDYENDFSMIDRNGEYIYIRHHQNYIFIYLGKKEIAPKTIFEGIEAKIQ